MKFIPKALFLICFICFFSSCKKLDVDKNVEEESAEQSVVGKWHIEKTQFLGQNIPGDGSYLIFFSCENDSVCKGEDYTASEKSTGSFTYTLVDSGKKIEIVDTLSAGGGYNGTWNILQLKSSTLEISSETFLGTMTIEMSKVSE